MTDQHGYQCTLAPGEVPDRAAQIRALTGGLHAREREGQRVRLRFDPALADVLAAFVRDEAQCCSFYDVEIEQAGQAVQLTVWAPAQAEPLLQRLYEVFDPGQPGLGG